MRWIRKKKGKVLAKDEGHFITFIVIFLEMFEKEKERKWSSF